MEAIFLVRGAGGPQLKRNPLGCAGSAFPMPTEPLVDTADAAASALFRHAAAGLLWFGRFLLSTPPGVTPRPIALLADVALLAAYAAWVNKPLQVALGSRFAKRPHWSALFVIPGVVALFFVVRDAFLVISGLVQ